MMLSTALLVTTCPSSHGSQRREHPGRNTSVTKSWSRCRPDPSVRSVSHHRQHTSAEPLPCVRPAKRQPPTLSNGFPFRLATFFVLLFCCSLSTCQPFYPLSIIDPRIGAPDHFRLTLQALTDSGTLLIDQRPPPLEAIRKRQGSGAALSSVSSTPGSSGSGTPKASSTVAAPSTTNGASSTQTSNPLPLPSPFDSFLDTNFTSPSCPQFIHGFLSNATFKSCLPFSLLLTSSVSFFQASKSVVRITQTLDATCAANVTFCTSVMSNIANNLISASNCGADYNSLNPVVVEAYTDLIAYMPLYEASCLKNPVSSAYCYADAITNASSPTDAYIYALPLNQSLPGSSQPTCNACLQNTMAVFDSAAVNRSQPIASTYVGAAQQIDMHCGPNFVSASLPPPVSSAATLLIGNWAVRLAVLSILLGSFMV